jgi:hypothetical protein
MPSITAAESAGIRPTEHHHRFNVHGIKRLQYAIWLMSNHLILTLSDHDVRARRLPWDFTDLICAAIVSVVGNSDCFGVCGTHLMASLL